MFYKIAKFGFVMLLAAFLASFLPPELGAAAGAVFLLGGVVFCIAFKKFGIVKLCCFAAAAGTLLVSAHLARVYYPQKALDGVTAEITGRVLEIAPGVGKPKFIIKTDFVGADGAPQKIKVKVSGWGENWAEPYDTVSCAVTFFALADEEISEVLTNRSGGVSLYGYLNSPLEVTGEYRRFPEYTVFSLREKLSSVVDKNFEGLCGSLTKQLLFGGGNLDDEIKDLFRAAGMSHILAVSGMHLVIIMGLLERLLSYKSSDGALNTAQTLMLMGATVLYMAVAGFGMSVMRAGFMLLASYLARLLWTKSASIDSLGFSVIAVLIIDPLACCDAGFLMSVLSSGAIILFSEPIYDFITQRVRDKEKSKFLCGIARVFSVGLAAWGATLPVAIFTFGGASLVAPFSSVVAGPLAEGAIICAFLSVLAGLIPYGSVIAFVFAWAAQICENLLFGAAKLFGSLPFAYVYASESWIKIWLIGALVLFVFALARKENARYLKHAALMAAFAFLCGMLSHSVMYNGTVRTEITALADGTAIQVEKGKSAVIVADGLTVKDYYKLGGNGKKADVFISTSSDTSPVEYNLANELSPKITIHSGIDWYMYEGAVKLSAGEVTFWDGAYAKIIPEGAVEIDTGDILILYIFGECDIMDLEPRFRKADIMVLDGVSPKDYPALRCDYMVLRNRSGVFSGAGEIFTLTEGELTFVSRGKNIKKGWTFR